MAKAKQLYEVLIPCTNKAGQSFAPGDVISGREFPRAVIDNWLAIDPPVLRLIVDDDEGQEEDGE